MERFKAIEINVLISSTCHVGSESVTPLIEYLTVDGTYTLCMSRFRGTGAFCGESDTITKVLKGTAEEIIQKFLSKRTR